MKAAKTESLICIECGGMFSTADIGGHLFFAESMTCYECFAKMAQFSRLISCFGKPDLYSVRAEECSRFCQDRVPCSMFVSGEIMKRLQVTGEAREAMLAAIKDVQKAESNFRKSSKQNPFTRGSIMRAVFDRLREENGMSRGEFEQYVDEMGGDLRYYLRILRKGFRNNVEWKFDESDNRIRITLL